MLSIGNLSKSYGSQEVFDEATLTMGRGERLGLVGRNGSGKTTLFRMILGQGAPDSGSITTPSGYRIGHLEQHIRFTMSTVMDEARLALPVMDDGRDESYKAEAILMGLGFTPEMMEADPASLSGGYQVRLNLAKTLVSEPDLLLLDEPTNYLDLLSIRWLKGFLRSWPREFIIITHDRSIMDSVTTHTAGIRRGKFIKVEGGTEKLYDRILMEEEHYEAGRLNDVRKRQDAERFISRFRAQATRARAVQSRIKQLGRLGTREKLSMEKDLSFSFNFLPFVGKSMLEVSELGFAYEPGKPLIQDLSMVVRKGDRIAIVGRNGAGKTTLMSLLAGALTPTSGAISINPKATIAYFGQTNVERLHPGKTVEEEIMDANPSVGQRVARNLAGGMMFEGDAALKKISVLSGGEKSRVMLGRILATPANLLLLDEPSNHLDVESVDSLLAAIDNFEGAVIIVTHSEMILEAVAERLIVFDEGRASLFEGTYRDFLARKGFSTEGATGPSSKRATDPLSKRATSSTGASSSDVAGSAPGSKPMHRKELKRLRAKLTNERSRTLMPLKDRMAAIEKEIMAQEARVEECEHALVAASTSGEAASIGELSKNMHSATEKVEALFDELAALSDEHDTLEAGFEQRLKELG